MYKIYLEQPPEIKSKIKTLLFWGFCLGISLAFYNATITTLFVYKFDVKLLLTTLLLSGIIGIIVMRLYTIAQQYYPIYEIIKYIIGFLIILFSIIWLRTHEAINLKISPSSNIVYWAFVWLFPINTLLLQMFWNTYENFFSGQQNKLFRNIVSLGLTSAQIGSFGIAPVFVLYSNYKTVLGLSIIPLIFSFVFFLWIGNQFKELKILRINVQQIKAFNTFAKLRKKRYIVLLSVIMFLIAIVSVSTYFFFLASCQSTYRNYETNELDKFGFLTLFCLFTSISLFVSFLIKSFLYETLVKGYGLKTVMLTLPIGLGFFLAVITALGFLYGTGLKLQSTVMFILLLVCRLVFDILNEAILLPAYRLHLLPIDNRLRLDTQLKLEGFVWYLGIFIAGFFQYIVQEVLDLPVAFQASINLLPLSILFYIVILLNRDYKQILRKILIEQETTNTKTQETTKTFLPLYEKMSNEIFEIKYSQIRYQLNILQIINPLVYKNTLIKLLDSRDGKIKQLIKESKQTVKDIVNNLHQKTEPLKRNNSTETIGAALYKKIRKLAIDRKKQMLSLDEKVYNYVTFFDDQVNTQALEGNMNYTNSENKKHQIDDNTDITLQKIAVEVEESIFQSAMAFFKQINQLTLTIDENTQAVVLLQAQKWCILEAIPILYILINSKYFPTLRNADLIKKTYEFLRGAEYRLERVKYIEQLTLSKLTEERISGALLTAYANERVKARLLQQLLQDQDTQVRKFAVIASANTDSLDLLTLMIDRLAYPLYGNAVFAAMVATGEQIFNFLESVFYTPGQKEIIQLRIVQIYGYVSSALSIQLLLQKINYSNQNVGSMALDMLSKVGFRAEGNSQRAINIEIENTCQTIVWNMSVYLDIERQDGGKLLIDAFDAEIIANYDKLFSLLALIYDNKSINMIKENIRSGDADKTDFALELLDVVLSETTKPVLIPLMDTSTYKEKVAYMQNVFPTDPMDLNEVLFSIIQRDYKLINNWTKACALDLLAQKNNIDDRIFFLANVVNPDVVMSEIAFKAMYNLDRNIFEEKISRIRKRKDFNQNTATASKVLSALEAEDQTVPILKFEIAKFLKEVKQFNYITGLLLAKIAGFVEVITAEVGQNIASYNYLDDLDYYVVYDGKIVLETDEQNLATYQAEDFLSPLAFINEPLNNYVIKAQQKSVVYKIPQAQLNELMSFYDEIPKSFLRALSFQS